MNVLALIWVLIIAFGVIMYVILDGYALGIGILSLFVKEEADRDIMISVILPVWDGNQTWLVFGGAALYGAFPLAFSMILPAIYIPIIIMVIALLLRGVAFEFRLKSQKMKNLWGVCFFLGALIATWMQGVILGTFVEGFDVHSPMVTLTTSEWLNSFSIFCGFALVAGYALLGSNRLIIKTSGNLQALCFKFSLWLQFIILLFAIGVSLWSPFLNAYLEKRWLNPEYMGYLSILPIVTMILFLLHWRAVVKKQEIAPYWCSIGIFLMCYVGFIISVYPHLVPHRISYLEAAASRSTLLFMLVGAIIMLPLLLYYTYYAYHIFKGKVKDRIGYD